MQSLFAEVRVPFQKNFKEVDFPVVLSPLAVGCGDSSNFLAAVKEQKPWLEALLHKHRAILFHGFDALANASDFNDFVEAFGYEELPNVGGAAPRIRVVGLVYTANNSPPDQRIPFHHEMAHLPEYPTKLLFFCDEPPAEGGETPLVLSHVVYERMKEKHPNFVEKLEKDGLIYRRVMGNEDEPDSSIGRGWKSTFLTEDKSIAVERAAKLGMKLEWTEDGVIMTTGIIPAVKYDETRQRKTWFNSMAGTYTAWADKRNEPKKKVMFGDGSPLPEEIILDCLEIMKEESIDVPWQKGDGIVDGQYGCSSCSKTIHPSSKDFSCTLQVID